MNIIFLSNPVSVNNKIIKNKRGLELVTLTLQVTKQIQKNSFIPSCLSILYCVLPDQVWWCNIKCFLSYSKNYISNFMQANSWHHELLHFHLSSWIWKVWKMRERITKLEYLKNEKSFFNEMKNIFYSFWRAIIWWKNKNFIKNSGHKL